MSTTLHIVYSSRALQKDECHAAAQYSAGKGRGGPLAEKASVQAFEAGLPQRGATTLGTG